MWDVGGRTGTLEHALGETVRTRRVSPRRVSYVRRLLGALDAHGPEVDRALARALDNWRMDRLSLPDLAVLRIGAVELLRFDDVPPKVSIQEAVMLAESYGGPDSPRFVNGVLDALYKGAVGPSDREAEPGPGP